MCIRSSDITIQIRRTQITFTRVGLFARVFGQYEAILSFGVVVSGFNCLHNDVDESDADHVQTE